MKRNKQISLTLSEQELVLLGELASKVGRTKASYLRFQALKNHNLEASPQHGIARAEN